MTINELIAELEAIRAKHGGDLRVGYVDNGPFSGGWTLVDSPVVDFNKDGKAEYIVL